jgi:hypothetical protein
LQAPPAAVAAGSLVGVIRRGWTSLDRRLPSHGRALKVKRIWTSAFPESARPVLGVIGWLLTFRNRPRGGVRIEACETLAVDDG